MFKFQWIVIGVGGDIQQGIADTFAEALTALAAWYGDGCPDPQEHDFGLGDKHATPAFYQIQPIQTVMLTVPTKKQFYDQHV